MKELTILQAENIYGGGLCEATAVAGLVIAVADGAALLGWLALNPVGAGILVGASLGLAGYGVYCAFS
jgi:hypothetical protein